MRTIYLQCDNELEPLLVQAQEDFADWWTLSDGDSEISIHKTEIEALYKWVFEGKNNETV